MEKEKTYGVVNASKEKAEITLNLISRCTAAYNGFPGFFLCVFFYYKAFHFLSSARVRTGRGGKSRKKQVLSIFHPVGGEPVQVNQLLFHCG